MKEVIIKDIAVFYSDRFYSYKRNLTPSAKSKKNDINQAITTNQKYTGDITKYNQRIIEQRLTAWLLSFYFYNQSLPYLKGIKIRKPTFFTLTLPAEQTHTDYEIKKKVLQLFIKNLRYSTDCDHIFWKSEKQGNGNLHFHCITDTYIDKHVLQTVWNNALEGLGYITEFEKKHNHKNPPSTHIEKVKNISGQLKYMQKYVSKVSKSDKVSGKVYNFSKGLLDLVPYSCILSPEMTDNLRHDFSNSVSKTFKSDYVFYVYLTKNSFTGQCTGQLKRDMERYYIDIYKNLYEVNNDLTSDNKKPLSDHKQPLISKQLNLFASLA